LITRSSWLTLFRFEGWFRTAAIVVGLNAFFLAIMLLASTVPAETMRERALQAFETGSLSTQDRRRFDSRIGWHQYNDCLILQMISNDDEALPRSLGPLVYYPEDFRGFCAAFRALLEQELTTDELYSFRYTRYWHGHNAVTAALLVGLDFETVRHVLRAAAYLSLLVLFVVALRSGPQLRAMGLIMALFGAAFWGLPYFAQSPSHGPGDTAVVLGFVVLLALARRGLSISSYQALCASFGATLVFMEFLTGLLPTAAAMLLPLGYLAARSAEPPAGGVAAQWRFALAGLFAFGLGVVLTALLKQLFAVAAFGPEVVEAFTNNLNFYVQDLDRGPDNRLLMGFYTAISVILKWGTILAYGSGTGARMLFGSAMVAWGAAFLIALRLWSKRSAHLFAVCAAGAAIILIWILIIPTHTFHHPYMVRMMIAPIALGWIALALQIQEVARQRNHTLRAAQTGVPQ